MEFINALDDMLWTLLIVLVLINHLVAGFNERANKANHRSDSAESESGLGNCGNCEFYSMDDGLCIAPGGSDTRYCSGLHHDQVATRELQKD